MSTGNIPYKTNETRKINNLLTFHYIGCLIGILIIVHYGLSNKHINELLQDPMHEQYLLFKCCNIGGIYVEFHYLFAVNMKVGYLEHWQ